jgi:branched-chain amino acid transport system permease protein
MATVELPAAKAADHSAPSSGPTLAGLALRGIIWLGLAYWVLVSLPRSEDTAGRLTDAVTFAIIGLSLNIIIGYTGQLSLGHQGFVGAGAFAAAYTLTVQDFPFALSLVMAALIGAFLALIIGAVALRITGLYLSLITLVFGITLESSLFQQKDLTNSGAGQEAFRPDWLIEPQRYYYFCFAIMVAVLLLDWRLTRTKVGRALLALKENERVAAAFGINVTAFKLLAFVLSGAIAGLGGGLFAYRYEVVNGSDYDFFLALTFVLIVVVGGLGSRIGVLLGAVLFSSIGLRHWLEEIGFIHRFLERVLAERAQFAPDAIGAFLLILTLLQFPGGIAQQIQPITTWLTGGRFSLHRDKESGPGAVEGSSARA